MKRTLLLSLLLSLVSAGALQAQYFGRNKPRYQKQNFKVTQTEHFEIYEYLDNPEKLRELATAAELWYAMHQAVLHDTLTKKNPLIIYSDHAGFQQTGTISGIINVGTGGVTEGLRNRVIFPVAMTNQQTHHVLGHEMVHAFQYNMVLNGDSTSMRNLQNLPLWMIEGLAEYLSIGRVDAHTALWMRDAVLHNDLPDLRDLNNTSRYFPYRWGQAFWAFVAGTYGDEAISQYFMNTAKYGLEYATRMTLGTTTEALALNWHSALRNHYGRYVGLTPESIAALDASEADRKSKDKRETGEKITEKLLKSDKAPGKKLFDENEAGEMTISPVLSPNGKYVIFLSENVVQTTSLVLAEAASGKIIKKVASTASDGHVDQFNYIASAGTWSPDNKRFAFDVYEKGQSVLFIEDVAKGKTVNKIKIPGVPAFSNPAWSPDGKTIVVSGLVDGQTDLYAYDLKTKKVRRLTNDRAAEILPQWSADGRLLTYSTDKISLERGRSNGAWNMNLAVMDMETGTAQDIDIFPGADNMNPQFDKAGNLLFLSNRDGFRNLYWYKLDEKKVYQMTKLSTGITGITPYSPAITVADDRDRILYTHFSGGKYRIYQAKSTDFVPEELDPMSVDMVPATLPPFAPGKKDRVNTNLRLLDNNTGKVADSVTLKAVKYKPKFNLDYIGGSTGVATGNSSFGTQTGLAGGIDMLFNDMLGNNQLYAGLALNGEITDVAGQFSYINQKNRIGWGFNLSHLPYRSGQYFQDPDFEPQIETTLDGQQYFGYKDELYISRLFQERIGVFALYPLSVTKRFEVGAAYDYYHQRLDRYYNYVDASGFLLGQDREKIPSPGSDNLWNLNAAYVGDNSYFGMTAPLQGWRYRVGVEQFFGSYRFSTLLLDGRRYFYLKPVTFAVRGMSYLRMGGNSGNTNEVYPLFAGESYFVRGYTSNVLYEDAPELIDQMAGSKLIVANFEIRLPFTGPRKLSVLKSGFLITDLNLFFDAGLGFFDTNDLKKNPTDDDPFDGRDPIRHKPILSTGVSMRVNLFGVLVLEPYFALPLSVPSERRNWTFGMNWIPGW